MTTFTVPVSAKDLMTPAPVTVNLEQTIQEAVVIMSESRISALPVLNDLGQPIGVLSQSDILRYEREKSEYLEKGDFLSEAAFYQHADLMWGEDSVLNPLHLEQGDMTRVEDVMTPLVYSVYPETETGVVIERMLEKKVHRLFVVNHENRLVGVISTFDVLRHLKP